MANFSYNKIKARLLKGDVDFDTADVRALLAMTNTTADTEKDVATISAFTLLDDFDGSGYTAGGIALTGETVVEDFASNRAYFDATDISWATLGAGTRQAQGLVVYLWQGTLGTSWPLCWMDTGGFPFTASGANVNVTWNAAGIYQLT